MPGFEPTLLVFALLSFRVEHLWTSEIQFKLDGDILIGGLFPVHENQKSGNLHCKKSIQFARGIQRVEAMKYAIEKLNEKPLGSYMKPVEYPHKLGIRVGAVIKDTCGSPNYAQQQSLDFVMASLSQSVGGKYTCSSGNNSSLDHFPAVVGASSSSVSVQVANLLGLFHVSQVSPASTGYSLSDKKEYPFFTRTVPPDKFQAAAIVDIVHYFKWSYVHLVYSMVSFHS